MAGPNDKKPNPEREAQLRANMGKYMDRAKPINETLNPGKAPPPKAPGPRAPQGKEEIKYVEQGGTGKGRLPPFPVIAPESLAHFQEAKQTDYDTFGNEQSGAFDPELNEMALKEVAKARGITVEELLKSNADRKAELKLKPAAPTAPPEVPVETKPPSSFITEDEERELEARLAEIRRNTGTPPHTVRQTAADLSAQLWQKQILANKKKAERLAEENKTGIPREYNDNPVIERLRKKLSIEAIQPCKVDIEDISFEMLPPPSGLNLWILEKMQASESVAGGGAPLALTIKLATVCAAITKIDGVPIHAVLEVPKGDDLTVQMIGAQTLWEMMIGLPSRAGLFSFDPELGLKLYEAYLATFGNRELKTTFQEDVYRYICPVDGCLEMYDMLEPASGGSPFCKVHGAPMENKGLVKELRSVPLV